ncbi:uncharacterized protein LOC118757013 [Rhagoletis pomonella]|uniref:uncharacterized protein LOC118757013 n=1 Tax=Rhagoletis pomonella TaxID=28610 RepID=UPI001782E840|nr:uncharacterized protein LOC118757013 [Rhagoletis pomonella]
MSSGSNGRTLTAIPEPPPESAQLSLLKRYKIVQWIQVQFWQRWQQDYLKELQTRCKWQSAQPNLKVNDLVLLKDDLAPPLKWPMGRIIDVMPGEDGRVRVVQVKTAEGIYKRSITKVCKLPTEFSPTAETN